VPAGVTVSDTLERVYRVFAMPVPAVIDGCPCCIATRGVDVLLTNPLRSLTGQQLWRYVSGAFLTIGGEQDFRYFLPRILDISVNDPGNASHAEVVLGKLALANWQGWSRDEREAVEAFVGAWFDHALAVDLATISDGCILSEMEGILCGAARAGLSLGPLLARLTAPEAAPVLAELRALYPRELSPFWEDVPGGVEVLAAFLSDGRG
jgi:hypothetical protein